MNVRIYLLMLHLPAFSIFFTTAFCIISFGALYCVRVEVVGEGSR